jgi:hypothetical protein
MEQLIEDGAFPALLDMTTTELADEVGGWCHERGTEPAGSSGPQGHSPADLPWRDQHGKFRAWGNGTSPVPGSQLLPPQPQRHSESRAGEIVARIRFTMIYYVTVTYCLRCIRLLNNMGVDWDLGR